MLTEIYYHRRRTRGLLHVGVEEPHLIVLPLLQPTLLADLVLGWDVLEVVDLTTEDCVAEYSSVGTLDAVVNERGAVRGLHFQVPFSLFLLP